MSIPVAIGPWPRGVNLTDPIGTLGLDELRKCYNYRLGPRGNPYKIPGFNKYNSNKVNGDVPVNLLFRYYKKNGTKKLIAAAAGKLKYGNDNGSGVWTDISINGTGASMEATSLCDWEVYKDRAYITDGGHVQRYNGTDNLYAGGISPNAFTVTANSSSGGLSPGTYWYLAVFVFGDMGEGPPTAPVSVVITGSDHRSIVSSFSAPSSIYEATFLRLYRTKVGSTSAGPYYLTSFGDTPIGVLPTGYNDTGSDSVLGAEYIPSKIPPIDAKYILAGSDDRMYYFGMGTDPSLVNVSDVGFPDRIIDDGVSGFFTVANNDGDILTGGGRCSSGTVFFKRKSMHLLRQFGYGMESISPKEKRGGGIGSLSHFCIVNTSAGLIFLSQRGEMYLYNGTELTEIGRNVSSEFQVMNEAAFGRAIASYHDYRYIISYDSDNRGYNWKTLEYDILTNKWDGPHYNTSIWFPSYYAVYDSGNGDLGQLAWGNSKGSSGSYIYIRKNGDFKMDGARYYSALQTGKLYQSTLGKTISRKIKVAGEFKITVSTTSELSVIHIDDDETQIQKNKSTTAGVVDVTRHEETFTMSGGTRGMGPRIELTDINNPFEVNNIDKVVLQTTQLETK